MGSLTDKIKARRRLPARIAAVGQAGVNTQDKRAKAAGAAGAGREAVKRVGEYKRGKVDKSDGNNTYINRRKQDNPRGES
jgi:hypothetical protein